MEYCKSIQNTQSIFLFLTIFASFILPSLSLQNLISMGDFQQFSSALNNNGAQRDLMLSSNSSSWYDYNKGSIQLKQFPSLFTTVCIDLSSSIPYILCQTLQLETNRIYLLKYDLYCQSRLQKMNLSAIINSKQVSTLYIQNPDTFSSKKDYFQPIQEKNVVCFQQIHEKIAAYQNISLDGMGGLIDNISLVVIPLWNIEVEGTIIEDKSLLILNCTEQSEKIDLFSFFSYYFLDQKESRTLSFSIKSYNSSFISLQVSYSYTLNLNKLGFSPKSFPSLLLVDGEQFDVKFTIRFQNNAAFYLSSSQKETLVTLKRFSIDLAYWIIQLVNSCKLGLASYFILTLIGFEHITLLYIFLDIPIVPSFTKDVYYNLLQIYFGDGNMLTWSSQLFKFNRSIFHIEQENRIVSEQIGTQRNGSKWIGYFGISNYFFNNNIDCFMLITLLIVKLLLLKLMIRFMRQKMQMRVKLKICLVILVQFASMIPGFVLSSFSSLIFSRLNIYEKSEHSLQVVLIFCCLSITPLYLIGRRHKFKKKRTTRIRKDGVQRDKNGSGNRSRSRRKLSSQTDLNHGKLRLKKTKSLKSEVEIQIHRERKIKLHKVKIKTHDFYSMAVSQMRKQVKSLNQLKDIGGEKRKFYFSQTCDILLLFSTSFLVSFDHPLVLLVGNTFIIWFKCLGYYQIYQWKGKINRIIQLLIDGIWVAHHCIFVIFYILGQKQEYRNIEESSNQKVINLGVAAIFTIFLCTVLQLLKFVIEFVRLMVKCKNLICNCFSGSNCQVHQKRIEEKQKQEVKRGKMMKEKLQIQQIQEISNQTPIRRVIKKR